MKFGIGLKIKPHHGEIFRYMVEHNLTVKQLASIIGISYTTLIAVLNFRWFPSKGNNYQRRITKEKLEKFFGCSIEKLFPRRLRDQIEKNKEIRDLLQGTTYIHKEIDLEYLPFYAVPQIEYEEDFDEILARGELRKKFGDLFLSALNPTEEKVIRMRFGVGEKSLEGVARELGKSRERIRQIEAKALSKLKDKKNARRIQEFYE